ncbi:hypothetical protein C2G38_2127824 [Gigaspora rosea]|uniref:Serine-threonine/tyrosine-protein kinase catalytic domain-containing protein n=1 Tax=Gigaspora rosea TaxID=44941 RepID=A0A397U2R3_9GLOM|nr:hypothetical protein C2G38_2127824 [Gigaspora rosea]
METALKKLRPLIPPIPESCYICLMKRCWDNDPEKRPSALKICETFSEWQNDENILFKLTEYDKKIRQIRNAECKMSQRFYLNLLNMTKNLGKQGITKLMIIFLTKSLLTYTLITIHLNEFER